MKPAILVPYKDRSDYIKVFLDNVPRYLEDVNGIRDYVIYVAEQTSSDVFNLSLSRNVGASFALAENKGFSYLIFHDVDVIPVEKIDYGPRQYNVAWFMTAGSCKVLIEDFVKANGYNPRFVGWGSEDTEFYHRLSSMNCDVKEWHRTEESKDAVMLSLEMPSMSALDAMSWSRSYFGYAGDGPLFRPFHPPDGGPSIKRYDKSRDFFDAEYQRMNDRLWASVHGMPPTEKLNYIKSNGLNLVDVSGVSVKDRTEKIVWLKYEGNAVLMDQ
jgi:hypothetical protein